MSIFYHVTRPRRPASLKSLLAIIMFCAATPADARQSATEQSPDEMVIESGTGSPQLGQTAESSVGRVGERQNSSAYGQEARIQPMGRINMRIQNRIQARIRNRIDRNYDLAADANSPFVVAEQETSRTPRR